LVFSLQSSVSGFSRTDSILTTPQLVQRLDVHPQVSMRLPSLAGFSLIPRVGIRETYYSGRRSDSAETQYVAQSLNRSYGEFELELRTPTLEKKFDTSWLGKFTHVVEPVAMYRRIHGITQLGETLRFDDLDVIADTNEITYGLVNRIFRSREVKPGTYQQYEFLSLGFYQKYYFDPTFGGAFRPGAANIFYPLNTLTGFSLTGIQRNLAPASMVARVSPTTGISYDARADFDMRLQRLRDASVSMFWQKEKLFASGTYFKTQALEPVTFDSHHIQGQVGYGSVLKGLSASVTLSYNIFTDKLLNSHSRVNYMWDCCGLSFEFQQFDLGQRTESRVSFSFTLKGIGSFGNIKRPESLF
jgi:LPS-assembly protein